MPADFWDPDFWDVDFWSADFWQTEGGTPPIDGGGEMVASIRRRRRIRVV